MSTGYSWRKLPPDESHFPINRYSPKNPHRKRKIVDDEVAPKSPRHNRKYFQSTRLKRTKTPRILGQSLPVNRLIEVLDHQALQNLLQAVVNHHPEVASTISKIAPRPSASDAITLMQAKFDSILHHLPYKCDVESDYSYIRIKSHLTEFLNCLSDFILNLLPPMESNLPNACTVLDKITNMIHDLPNFSNNEFQYTKAMAYEQIANSWLIVLMHKADEAAPDAVCDDSGVSGNVESSLELIKTIEELDLQNKIEKHNEVCMGKFSMVADFIKAELDAYEQINHRINSGGSILSDFITVDYSNYSIAARTSH